MAKVHIGKRWEQSLGNYSFACGTLAYLAVIKAEPVPHTSKYVPDEELGPEGQYDHA